MNLTDYQHAQVLKYARFHGRIQAISSLLTRDRPVGSEMHARHLREALADLERELDALHSTAMLDAKGQANAGV